MKYIVTFRLSGGEVVSSRHKTLKAAQKRRKQKARTELYRIYRMVC